MDIRITSHTYDLFMVRTLKYILLAIFKFIAHCYKLYHQTAQYVS